MAEAFAIDRLRAGYGESVVVEDVSLAIDAGECVALLGRNGAGKTTLITAILGLARQHGGSVRCAGVEIGAWPAHRRARFGIGWAPQERRMWRSLTVDEHLEVVARPGPWTAARVHSLFPGLAQRRRHRGNELSGGEQQMLAVGRALVTNPKVLLLDEPMEGLAPIVARELTAVIHEVVREGAMAVLLVEQHAAAALAIARRAVVMERGRVAYAGGAGELAADRALLERLLGVR